MAWTHQLTVTYPNSIQPAVDVSGDPTAGATLQAQILARAAELQSQGIASANASEIDNSNNRLTVTRNFNSEAAAIDWKNYIDQQFASVVHTSVIQAL